MPSPWLTTRDSTVAPSLKRIEASTLVCTAGPLFVEGRTTVLTHNARRSGQESFDASVSDDGRYTAFTSWAGNLLGGDVDTIFRRSRIFLYDAQTGLVTRITPPNAQGDSWSAKISGNGRYVVFYNTVPDLISDDPDANGSQPDLFRFDRATQTIDRLTPNISNNGIGASVNSRGRRAISRTGERVVFLASGDAVHSQAGGPVSNIKIFDATMRSQLLPQFAGARTIALSSDGNHLAFVGSLSNREVRRADGTSVLNFLPYTVNWVDLQTNQAAVIASNGVTFDISGLDYIPAISADGRFIAFESRDSAQLPESSTSASSQDVYRWDRSGNQIERVTARRAQQYYGAHQA